MEKELLQCGVQLERFGGDTQSVRISALTVWATAARPPTAHPTLSPGRRCASIGRSSAGRGRAEGSER